ncbi:hypothetical protein B296_00041916 [Ensete ventricosum]|uniref:S-acyltransferase n=1 Tax=Ensete ventricosum TaxID=4639 RepID=A0A426Z8S6_ENSVE|nr:hypothetical protein B296_00041916 [Ensete ventricosum]
MKTTHSRRWGRRDLFWSTTATTTSRDQSSMRRHGWQLPLHPLQVSHHLPLPCNSPFRTSDSCNSVDVMQFVGMAVFCFLVIAFFVFLGPFLGNRVLKNTILTLFFFTALSVAILYSRCTAIDPSDRTAAKKRKRSKSGGLPKLNYRFMLWQVVVRFFRKVEGRILRRCIRRKYLDPWHSNVQMQPLLSFPLVFLEDAAAMPDRKDDDITFCTLCDFEVKKHSKHCRSCDRCVDGFDHHCRVRSSQAILIPIDPLVSLYQLIAFLQWLNNCIGRKNYTTFILLMLLTLLMVDSSNPNKKTEFHIDPWKLIKMSKEKTLMAAERARERMRQKLTPMVATGLSISPLKPLPLEMKHGPLMNPEAKKVILRDTTPVVPRGWFPSSPSRRLSSPRWRFSGSPSPRPQKYRSSFDPKLTEVSRELETYISKQVLCSVLKQGEDDESSPQ